MIKQEFEGRKFGDALKIRRTIECRLGLREMGELIGVSPATLSRCENGSLPDLLTYSRLCHWINRPMNDFIKVTAKKSKPSKHK